MTIALSRNACFDRTSQSVTSLLLLCCDVIVQQMYIMTMRPKRRLLFIGMYVLMGRHSLLRHCNSYVMMSDVSSDCEALGASGNCSFYDCFEQRFQCGSHGYALAYGGKYCRRLEGARDAFTDAVSVP